MLRINDEISIPDWCLQFTATKGGGPGGQHVNKNATGIELRVHIPSLPILEAVKQRLLKMRDRRINQEGWIVIIATGSRSQEMNKNEALERLRQMVAKAAQRRKRRRPTKPTRGSIERRLQQKKERGAIKSRRKNMPNDYEADT